MSVVISPIWSATQFFDNNGNVLSGGKLYTYQGGSWTVKQTTYTDNTGDTPNTNPIVLDIDGRIQTGLFLTTEDYYNFNLTDANNVTVTSQENVQGISFQGTVTSVTINGTTDEIDVAGTIPITTTGTVTISIDADYAGQPSITTLGTITTGTWQATPIAISEGGTGTTDASTAINALLPSQSGNSGDVLSTNGTTASWVNPNTLVQSLQYLSSNYTNATSTTTAIFPGITTTGSNVYLIEWMVVNSPTSNDFNISIIAPTSSTVTGFYAGTAQSYVQDPITAVNTAYGLIALSSPYVTGQVVVTTSSTTGTLTLGAAMYSTGTTVTLTSGSWLRITDITG